MKTKSRIITWLLAVLMACALGFMVTFTVNSYADDSVSINQSDIYMSELTMRQSTDGTGNPACGLYSTYLNLFGANPSIKFTKSSYGIMDGANKGVQEKILINGKTIKEINSSFDTSDWIFDLFPWNAGATYAVPVLGYVGANTSRIELIMHVNYLAELEGKLELTVKSGLTYIDDTITYVYNGEDLTFKFMASKWYAEGQEPEYSEINTTGGGSNSWAIYEPANGAKANYRLAIPLNQIIHGNTRIGDYHFTQPGNIWNQLQNYVKVNGQTLAQINSSIDDSSWDYSSANWWFSWASSVSTSGYCQPAYVQVSSSTMYINFHNNLLAMLGDALVVEILPGFGIYDTSTGDVFMNSAKEIVANFKDLNGSSSMAKATDIDGIDVVNDVLPVTYGAEEYSFDINFSANIMKDDHYTGPVTFDYFGDIWANYIYVTSYGVNNQSISTLTDYARMEVATGSTFDDLTKVRIYLKNNVAELQTSITLKKGMPFSSGEVLSKDYVITFNTLATTDDNSNVVLGYTAGSAKYKPGTTVGSCLAANETSSLSAVTMTASDFEMVYGASIRYAQGSSGLRFSTRVSDVLTEKLVNFFGEDKFAYSVLVERSDATSRTVDVSNWNGFAVDDEGRKIDGFNSFSVSLLNIYEVNYDKVYTATARLTVTYADGSTLTFNATANDNGRSIRQIADSVYAAEAGVLEDWQIAILDTYRTKA